MIRSRLLAALLFAASAAVGGVAFGVVAGAKAGSIWAIAIVVNLAVTIGVAASAAPALNADARRSPSRWRGFIAGAIVTVASFAVSAVLLLALLTWDGPSGLLNSVGVGLLALMAAVPVFVTLCSPLLAIGGVAGMFYYRLTLDDARNAT